jgi:hypothetical protein
MIATIVAVPASHPAPQSGGELSCTPSAAPAWPPADAAAMRAWQAAVGDDAAIALRLGLSRATVYIHRRRHGVAALLRESDRRVREKRPRARLSKRAMARLYAGRRYEDTRLCRRPDYVVAGAGWAL